MWKVDGSDLRYSPLKIYGLMLVFLVAPQMTKSFALVDMEIHVHPYGA